MFLFFLLLSCANTSGSCPEVELANEKITQFQTVEYCSDATVPASSIKEAFDWWNSIGPSHKIPVWINSECTEEIQKSTIRFHNVDYEDIKSFSKARNNQVLAYTLLVIEEEEVSAFFKTVTIAEIVSAQIYLQSSNDDIAIKHEIGHAYGYAHVDFPNHIMGKYGGTEICGLRRY